MSLCPYSDHCGWGRAKAFLTFSFEKFIFNLFFKFFIEFLFLFENVRLSSFKISPFYHNCFFFSKNKKSFFFRNVPILFAIQICLNYVKVFWVNYINNVHKNIFFATETNLNSTQNKTARIRCKCRKTTALSCHRHFINTGVEEMSDV